MQIHSTAVVDPNAVIDPTAEIGPYAIVHDDVHIGARTKVGAHVVIHPHTTIGTDNVLHAGSCFGDLPQSIGFDPAVPSTLVIGDGNTFRESFTAHRGEHEGGITRIGNNNFFMVGTHVGHDCNVGNNTVFANYATLGGHAHVDDSANLSAFTAVHQYCRIGRLAMMQGSAAISLDLPPFTMAAGRNTLAGLNVVGIKRAGISKDSRKALRRAYRTYFLSERAAGEALEQVETEHGSDPHVAELAEFIRESQRGVLRRQRTQRARANADAAYESY